VANDAAECAAGSTAKLRICEYVVIMTKGTLWALFARPPPYPYIIHPLVTRQETTDYGQTNQLEGSSRSVCLGDSCAPLAYDWTTKCPLASSVTLCRRYGMGAQ